MSKEAILSPLQKKKDNINRYWKNKELKSNTSEWMKRTRTLNKELIRIHFK